MLPHRGRGGKSVRGKNRSPDPGRPLDSKPIDSAKVDGDVETILPRPDACHWTKIDAWRTDHVFATVSISWLP